MKYLLIPGIILMIIFSSCKKEDNTVYQTYFWTNVDTALIKMDIYINDKNSGAVQYLSKIPECCEDSVYKTLISVPLKVGTYDFKAKDMEENTRFSAQVEIMKGGSVSANHVYGKLDIYGFDDNLAFGISF